VLHYFCVGGKINLKMQVALLLSLRFLTGKAYCNVIYEEDTKLLVKYGK
jgi:hypothetical protein